MNPIEQQVIAALQQNAPRCYGRTALIFRYNGSDIEDGVTWRLICDAIRSTAPECLRRGRTTVVPARKIRALDREIERRLRLSIEDPTQRK